MKSLLRSFWEATIVSGESVFVSCRSEKYQQALLLVKIFYFFLFFASTQSFSQFYQVPSWHQMQRAESMFQPIWSIFWITYLPWKMAVNGVLLFFITTSFAAVLNAVHYRWIRIATFIALLQYVSLNSSFGKVDHYLHAFIAVAFLFIFLPNHTTKSARRQTHFLQLFWGCQLWLLTAYSSSGLFKFLGIGVQLLKGEIHAFHPEALARNVAKGNLNFGNRMFFDTWLLDSPSWLFSAVQLAGYFLELTSIFIIFYPHLHRVWGLLLLGLHAGILLTVGPDFTLHMLVVAILLVSSPFHTPVQDWFNSWPMLSLTRQKVHPITVFYRMECSLSRWVVQRYLRSGRPEYIRFVQQSSPDFSKFIESYPALSSVRTIVVVEQDKKIRIKLEGIAWLLGHLPSSDRFYNFLLLIPRIITDFYYDWRSRSKQAYDEHAPRQSPTSGLPQQVLR